MVGVSVIGGAVAANAEGQRLSYIGDWSVGAHSNTWADSNGDAASTRVYLSGVKINAVGANASYTPSSVQLQLQRDVWGIGFTSQGNVTAAPGTYHNWGRVTNGTYRFQYNGSTYSGHFYGANSGFNLSASTANIYW